MCPLLHVAPLLRGFFRVGSAIHLIEPLDGGGEEGPHAVYQARHMQQKAGTCGVSDASLDNLLGPRVSAAFRPQPWVSSTMPPWLSCPGPFGLVLLSAAQSHPQALQWVWLRPLAVQLAPLRGAACGPPNTGQWWTLGQAVLERLMILPRTSPCPEIPAMWSCMWSQTAER